MRPIVYFQERCGRIGYCYPEKVSDETLRSFEVTIPEEVSDEELDFLESSELLELYDHINKKLINAGVFTSNT